MKKSLFVLQFDLTVTSIFDCELECNLLTRLKYTFDQKLSLLRIVSQESKKGQKFQTIVQKVIEKFRQKKCPQMKYNLHLCQILRVFWTLLAFLGPFWLYLDSFDPIVQIFAYNSPFSRSDGGFNSTFRISIYIQCERHFFPKFLVLNGLKR